MKQAVVIGAGSVGRGFIGQLFCEGGYRVTFVDALPTLVSALATDGCYPHVTVSNGGAVRTTIGPVTAVDAADEEAVVKALFDADLAATSVGARVLPKVAPVLAASVARRIAAHRPPLNVLLCENLHAAGPYVSGLIRDQLPDLAPATIDAALGLVETSIGRMIPAPGVSGQGDEPTAIFAEPYKKLPYDAAAVRGGALSVPGLVSDPGIPFAFFGDRKLHLHNLGHAMTAYLGERAGLTQIAEAIALPELRYLVRGAMVESALSLSLTYGRPLGELLAHVDDLIHRFGNRALGDSLERVGRDPIRKTAADDRLLGPFVTAVRRGLPSSFLSLAVAAGADALCRHERWTPAQAAARIEEGLASVQLNAGQRALLQAQLDALSGGAGVQEQIDIIDRTFEPSRVL